MINWLIARYQCWRHGHIPKEFRYNCLPYQICLRCGDVQVIGGKIYGEQ